jgi:hypothetical protein
MKWYVKLILIFGGMILFVGGFIAYDMMTSGEIIEDVRLPGIFQQKQEWTVVITETSGNYNMIVVPDVESGWGDPVVQMEISLLDPMGNVLINNVGKDGFGGEIANPNLNVGHTASYKRSFPFNAKTPGTYKVIFTTLTEHVEQIHISIERKQPN